MMKKTYALCVLTLYTAFAASAGFGGGRAGNSQESGAPTVVELFTSQGCSSCPPADKLLYEMAERDDVVAISWHVTYWDYIGWKDPFATDWGTNRQRAYRDQLGNSYVYTPQMVIDGRHDVVGSRRADVMRTISTSREESPERINVRLDHDSASGELIVTFAPRRLGRPLEIWLIGYSGAHETKVSRGENSGATLRNTHIARTMTRVGTWDGTGGTFRVAMPADDDVAGCAVILQEPGQGAIRGAAKLDLTS